LIKVTFSIANSNGIGKPNFVIVFTTLLSDIHFLDHYLHIGSILFYIGDSMLNVFKQMASLNKFQD